MRIQPHQDVEQHDEPAPQPKQKRAPFAQLPHYVLTNRKLSPGDRELYAHLDTYWRSDKDECWPSQETLAGKMDVSVCTVHRRAKKLAAAKLIEVKRQGLNKPNRYKRLLPPRPDLSVVPDPDAHDDQPDVAEVQAPDFASVQGLDLAAVQGEVDAVEADAREEDKGNTTAAAAPLDAVPAARPDQHQPLTDEQRSDVVRYMEVELLPVLRDLHEQKGVPFDEDTGLTLARLIFCDGRIHEGHIARLIDKLTGDVPDRRYSTVDADVIENLSGYVYVVLEGHNQGALPKVYEAMRGTVK